MTSIERNRLWSRLQQAVAAHEEPLPTPLMVVDLDAFDANADDLVRRARGLPIRVASKSLRVPALIRRALAHDGFEGVLAYTLAEALWLEQRGRHRRPGRRLPDRRPRRPGPAGGLAAAAGRITLMVDDPAHLDVIDSVRSSHAVQIRVAIDVDAGLWVGGQHVGPKRSPLHDTAAVLGAGPDDHRAARVPPGRRDDLRGPGRRRRRRRADPARQVRRRTPPQGAVADPAGGPARRDRRRPA